MTRGSASARAKTDWTQRGLQLLRDRDFRAAKACFARAVTLEKHSAVHRYHLAMTHLALSEFGAAAEQLTESLRLDPAMRVAAEKLELLVLRRLIPATAELNPVGLKAALRHDGMDREQIAEASVRYLSRQEPLRSALELGRADGWLAAARSLCLKRTADILKNDLFLKAIGGNLIRIPDLEYLLTAIRRVLLLEIPSTRFEDRALASFAIALTHQCWVNEYVWAVAPEETAALDEIALAADELVKGGAQAGIRLLIAALYRPATSVLGSAISDDLLNCIRPHAVRDVFTEQFAVYRDEERRSAHIRRLAPISDETSRKVAAQYGDNPYPRWTNFLQPLEYAETRKMLGRFFDPGKLAFMDRPFDVLIAGCGTGRQAIAAASAYGPNARVLAIDLSIASLAYGARMAERFSAANIEFLQADILDFGRHPEFLSRFHVIECAGVLHHMAEPLTGLRALAGCLANDGVMILGLYSALARRGWTALRSDPAYPGAGCDDAQLRAFRQHVLARPVAEMGAHFASIRDLYTTSGFRDLFLHVSERCHTIPEVAQFLAASGLVFRGFHNERIFDRLRQRSPDETWPGDLARWAELEEADPDLFVNMYLLWCEKAQALGPGALRGTAR